MNSPAGVSIVVCCYNSAAVIVPTLKALSAQSVPPGIGYEVILVDNNCTDETVRLAERTWKNPAVPMSIIKEPQPGLIHARKTGVFKARYDILLFIDDDNLMELDWIERLLDVYSRRPEVGGIGVCIEPLFEGEKPGWFDSFSAMYACTPPYENPDVSAFKQTLFGAGLSFRVQALRSVFDLPLPFFLVGRTQDALSRGDDSEICLRAGLMGWKLWYESTLKLKHYIRKHRANWGYVLQARRWGGQADIILKIYRDLLEEKTPLTYPSLSMYISSLWEGFWQNRAKHKDLEKINKEGDPVALRYHYLQGLTEGFLKTDKQRYDAARKKITGFFSERKTG